MRNFDGNMVAEAAIGPGSNAAEPAKFLERQVAARLREARKAARLTLMELAQRCGTTPQTIQRLETANMTLSVGWIEKLCEVLRVHPMALFADADAFAFQLERRVADICLEVGVLTMRSQDFAAKLQQFMAEFGGER